MNSIDFDNEAKHWFVCHHPRPQAKLCLYCLPHAGGGAATYRNWADEISTEIEIRAIQLPGRESRLAEPVPDNLANLTRSLALQIAGNADRPFAYFGHSLGALIGFELARCQRNLGLQQPCHLIVSGRNAPHTLHPDSSTARHQLSDADLLEELSRLQGTPQEILSNQDIMTALLPVIRADLKLVETYTYSNDSPLSCPISAVGATEDQFITRAGIEAWQQQTTESFQSTFFAGGHFFFIAQRRALLRAIVRFLTRPTAPN